MKYAIKWVDKTGNEYYCKYYSIATWANTLDDAKLFDSITDALEFMLRNCHNYTDSKSRWHIVKAQEVVPTPRYKEAPL